MNYLSKETLEKIAVEENGSSQQLHERIEREIRLLFEEIVKGYSK